MATQIQSKTEGETLVAAVNFSDRLTDGDTLTGTPTAVVSPSGPTLGAAAKNATTLTILLDSVAANLAVLYTIAGGAAGVTYTVTVTATTTSGQTLVERCVVKVDA